MSQSPGTAPGHNSWPRPLTAWYANGVLTLAFVLAFIDRQIIALLVGPIQQDLGISDTQVSLLGGFAFVFIYTFLGIPIGRLVDRRNRKRLIALGVFVWSCMTVACGLARNARGSRPTSSNQCSGR